MIGSHVTVRQAQKNTDAIKQGRLTARWKQDNLRLAVGGSYVEDHFKIQQSNTFANNYWQAYAGYGPASGGTTGVALPASLFNGTVSTNNFIPGYSGSLPPVLLNFNAQDYQNYLTGLGNPQAKNIPGFNYGCCDPRLHRQLSTSRSTMAASATSRKRPGRCTCRSGSTPKSARCPSTSMPACARKPRISPQAVIGQVPVLITTSEADQTLLTVKLSDPQTVSSKSSYSYLLPSLDMKLELTPNLHLRFDASRTLTRPALNLLTPVLNVGTGQRVGALTAKRRQPRPEALSGGQLRCRARNGTMSRNSYLSVDFFLKNVSNFIVGGTTRQTINGVIDPTTGQPAQFSVTQQVNGPDATVRGVEIALQHVFGDTGFGFNANATFVDTNKPYDANDISQSGFAVTGLANSANFVGFYDKNGFEARVAVNWRDEYLLQFGQNQNTGAFGAEPTFVNSSLQIDFSTSYQVTKQFNVFGEALNLTNQIQSTHGRYSNQLLDVYDYGRRYTAGVRVPLLRSPRNATTRGAPINHPAPLLH